MPSPLTLFIGSLNREAPYFQGARGTGLSVYRFVEDAGTFAPLAESTDIDNPTFLSFDAAGRTLYATSEVASWREGTVSAYRIDPASGALTYLNKQTTLGSIAAYSHVSPDGRHLLVADYSMGEGGPDQSLAVFPIRADGSLAPAVSSLRFVGTGPDPERQERSHAHCIVPAPDGRHWIAADLGTDTITLLALGEDGTLTERARLAMPPGSGPRHVAFHPDGRSFFVSNELTSTTASVGIEGNELRLLSLVPAIPEGVQSHAADIHVAPDGAFVYASNRGHDSISVFAVDAASRALTLIEQVPTGGATPRNFALTPSGNSLLVANQNGDSIVLFRRDPTTGRLTRTDSRLAIGTPMCVRLVAP
ncbi:6-phosphogluconolactonase [Kaistia hirudinis]|uniref:6-phosphogluconolactonase n=1 Tax=Kaistia hirudinis TaxID=1293440 RepID=A0A840AJB5_9HYPH|nr:lactonase family protein [Kaistia hirudinis]MBB3929403.1 6-phosphogluconolactonase [Kaistia hirudinis]